MNEERPEVDYGKARTSALKRLAATGDTKARDELRRRGETAPAADDLATKAYIELRDLVLVWRVTRQDVNAELTVTALEARRAMSFAAQAELERRYTEAEAAGRQPLPLPVPPWLRPRPPRGGVVGLEGGGEQVVPVSHAGGQGEVQRDGAGNLQEVEGGRRAARRRQCSTS